VVVTLSAGVNPTLAQNLQPPHAPVHQADPLPISVAPVVPSLGQLFQTTVSDFKRLPSRDTITWLSIGAVAALASRPADDHVSRNLSGALDLRKPLEPGAVVGSVQFHLGAAFATYTIGRLTGSPKAASVGADLFRAQALAQGTTFAMKYAVRRMRPDESNFSFPSGHTSSAFASATVLQRHFGWKAGIPAYVAASYVAASRVQMKRHYLSDVAFGAVLGIVAGRTVTVGRGDARFALGPIAAPAGVGVGFTWLGKK
jgi:membrane-associated phospholipid phosphatase